MKAKPVQIPSIMTESFEAIERSFPTETVFPFALFASARIGLGVMVLVVPRRLGVREGFPSWMNRADGVEFRCLVPGRFSPLSTTVPSIIFFLSLSLSLSTPPHAFLYF
jgi:hypothetical protein